jgi:hypothetical protein
MIHLFGIRHHGPGSARSVKEGLEHLTPDCILIEGPPEANKLLPMMLHTEMEPPVALLVYHPEFLSQAVFYPFATFSPEWQALHYGLKNQTATEFFDLPIAHRFAEVKIEQPQPEEKPLETTPGEQTASETPEPEDPLTTLARAAGYEDFERWWGHLVEERQDKEGVFQAILEAMTALREHTQEPNESEQKREAHMRQKIREAQKKGYKNIAVICGAWHTPALTDDVLVQTKTDDEKLLKNLSKTEVAVTWIPWTFGRLSRFSGYGAGITSPGWYQHLWEQQEKISIRWMSKVAALLREQDLEASSAQVIEAVRMADTLASLRGRRMAGLDELNEASYALFAHGNDLVLDLIAEKLIVGDRLGQVPSETPAAPLQQDLAKEIKRLRLKQDATVRDLELDLRNATDLARSQLFHRLNILEILWANLAHVSSKGTFKEAWQMKWEPEFAVQLIEMGRYGQSVADAATGRVLDVVTVGARGPSPLQTLTEMLDKVLLADLPRASSALLSRLETSATQSSDVLELMKALPPLARVLRYGNVRQSDTRVVTHVVDGLLTRVIVGLPNACASLSDEAATEMFKALVQVHDAVMTLQNSEQQNDWFETLRRLADQQTCHGLVSGRCVRFLLESQRLENDDVSRRVSLALSNPDPEKIAAWLEGFLQGSGLVLIHDDVLFAVLDRWLAGLSPDIFVRILPLLRRTFSSFETPERRAIGEKAKEEKRAAVVAATSDINEKRAAKVLPLVTQILNRKERENHV